MNCRLALYCLLPIGLTATQASAQRPLGPEFVLPIVTTRYQTEPAAALDGRGRGILLWEDDSQLSLRVVGRRLEGRALLPPFFDLSDAVQPDVAILPSGWAAVTWKSRAAADFGVRLTRYDENGMRLDSGIVVTTEAISDEIGGTGSPSAAIAPDHRVVVGFAGKPYSVTEEQQAWFRVFDASGQPVTPATRAADQPPAGLEFEPEVAILPSVGFVIVWSRESIRYHDPDQVLARRFAADGTPLGGEFLVPEASVGPLYWFDVASDAAGNFTVTWAGEAPGSGGYDVWMRRYAADGTALSGQVRANEWTFGYQYGPSVGMDSNGQIAVAWSTIYAPGGEYGEVRARLFRADGTPASPEFAVTEQNPAFEDINPVVALSDSGTLLVAWQAWSAVDEDYHDIRARRFLATCEAASPTLPLADGRFEACARFRAYAGESGSGQAAPLQRDTGAFWFFDPDNPELILKVLDGCGVNERFWVFAAGLTDVEVGLGIVDSASGSTWTTQTALGVPFGPVEDVEALATCAGAGAAEAPGRAPPLSGNGGGMVSVPEARAEAPGACVADADTLCLRGGRFRVEASFDSGQGLAGPAQAVPLSDESGLFWFFWPENLELFVKVLDGCIPFERYWVFAAGLTNVGVDLAVVDTWAGATWSRSNALGTSFPPILDAAAFATCP